MGIQGLINQVQDNYEQRAWNENRHEDLEIKLQEFKHIPVLDNKLPVRWYATPKEYMGTQAPEDKRIYATKGKFSR